MFYFGWRRSDVQAREMSIDVSLFGFSTQDYVLRSVSALYLPLLVIFGLGLAWVAVHARVVRALPTEADSPRRRALATWAARIAVAATTLAVCCLVFALLAGLTSPPWPVGWLATQLEFQQWVVPLVLVTSTLVAAYARWTLHRLRPPPAKQAVPLWRALLPVVLVASTVALGGFWLLEEYAAAVGRGAASTLVANVDGLAHAVVVSPTPLGIVAPGVQEERIGAPDSATVKYRTTGLRLLARSGGKVLLLHDGWTPADGTVIVLADSDDLVWQFSR
jgi:hypothetical protein